MLGAGAGPYPGSVRILISVDLEGIAGIAVPDDVRPGSPEYQRGRRLGRSGSTRLWPATSASPSAWWRAMTRLPRRPGR